MSCRCRLRGLSVVECGFPVGAAPRVAPAADPGALICRMVGAKLARQHCRMEDQAERISEARSRRDYYWMVFCAALLVSVVVYAVFTVT